MIKKIIITLLVVGVVACGSTPPPKSELYLDKLDSNTLRLIGNINKENIEEILNYLDSDINKIVITSGGGEVTSNIRFGNLIRSKGIAVEVEEYCMSSCFNYVFLAASSKKIRKNSLIGFHGGVETTMAEISLPDFILRPLLKSSIEAEQKFLSDGNLSTTLYEDLIQEAALKTDINNISEDDIAFFYMIGPDFFEYHNIKLEQSWFPKEQQTLTKLANYYSKKHNKKLRMFGVFK